MPKTLAALFASLSFIFFGGKVFLKLMSTEISDIIHLLQVAGIAAVVFGVLGFFIGRLLEVGRNMFEENKDKFKEKDKELLIDDLLAFDIGVRQKPKENKGQKKK